jgi:hypothetical protein
MDFGNALHLAMSAKESGPKQRIAKYAPHQ